MCLYSVRVRGVKVMGRNVYRTDTGVKIGFKGPQVPLESALLDLDPVLAGMLKRSCDEIDRKMTERLQNAQREDAETETQADEVFGPSATVLSLNPPHVAVQEDEDNDPPETFGEDYRDDGLDHFREKYNCTAREVFGIVTGIERDNANQAKRIESLTEDVKSLEQKVKDQEAEIELLKANQAVLESQEVVEGE